MSEFGKYIVLEGGDGVGKSTQVKMLQARLDGHDIESVVIEEPAGAPISSALRPIMKNDDLKRDSKTDLLLFTAARRETHQQIIIPSLEQGTWVLAARNWISTMAYQGFGDGLQTKYIREITEEYTDKIYMNPDFMCILSLKNKVETERRIAQRGQLENPDAFESRDELFKARVEEGYETIAALYDIPTIDSTPAASVVGEEIWRHIEPLTEAA